MRGLPRSEENHSANGLQLDPETNTLYLAQGGNTNMGAPPTTRQPPRVRPLGRDPLRRSGRDRRQSLRPAHAERQPPRVTPTIPSAGTTEKNRRSSAGRPGAGVRARVPRPLRPGHHRKRADYTRNGSNAAWGDKPVNEGPGGTCTNEVSEPGTTDVDTLELVTAGGYGGHPNPTRGNIANTFGGQSPVSVANPVECEWRDAGEGGEHQRLPGVDERADRVHRVELRRRAEGRHPQRQLRQQRVQGPAEHRGDRAGGEGPCPERRRRPLDVVAQGDSEVFPGTIWVADIGNDNITGFEPGDYEGAVGSTCAGTSRPDEDEDASRTPTRSTTAPTLSRRPPPLGSRRRQDHRPQRPDDDNDGIPTPPIPSRSTPTTARRHVPVRLTWDNDAPNPGGLANLGFTGLISNNQRLRSLFDPRR